MLCAMIKFHRGRERALIMLVWIHRQVSVTHSERWSHQVQGSMARNVIQYAISSGCEVFEKAFKVW